MYAKRWIVGMVVVLLLTAFVGCQRQQKENPSHAEKTETIMTDQTESAAFDGTARPTSGTAATKADAAGEIDASVVLPDGESKKAGTGTTVGKTTVAPAARTTTEKPSKAATTDRTTASTAAPTTSRVLDKNQDGWVDGWYRPTTSKGGMKQ